MFPVTSDCVAVREWAGNLADEQGMTSCEQPLRNILRTEAVRELFKIHTDRRTGTIHACDLPDQLKQD